MAPSSGLQLENDGNSTVYTVNVTSFPNDLVMSFTSIVFRIEDQSSPGNYIYQWISEILSDGNNNILQEYKLDLLDYTCRTISVSYAFVTAEGMWGYSDPLTIEVVGKKIIFITIVFEFFFVCLVFAGSTCTVIQLESDEINISHNYDDREGFFGYFIANVSWPKANCM